jgi:hypothetical protein
MKQATGAMSRLVIGFQVDAVTPATEGFVMPIKSSTLKGDRTQIPDTTIRGNLNPAEPSDGNKKVAGVITIPMDSIAMWYWLKAAYGSPTTTGSASPWVHTFKAGDPDAPRPYLTVEHQFLDLDTPQYMRYTGVKINSMNIANMGADAELLVVLNVEGAQETPSTTPFDAAPTIVGLSKLKNNQLTLKEGGTTISNAKSLDCNIGWNCDTDQYVIGGGGSRGAIPDGVMSVGGNLSALFQNMDLLDKATNSTKSSIEATFTGSSTSALVKKFPEVKYTPSSPGIEGPKGIVIKLPWGGFYKIAAEETSVQTVLTNTEEHA